MALVAIILCFAVLTIVFWRELRQSSAQHIVTSPFWYFSFLYLIAFPIRGLLLDFKWIRIQTYPDGMGYHFDPMVMAVSLLFSLVLWGSVYYGRKHTVDRITPNQNTTLPVIAPVVSQTRIMLASLIVVLIAASGIWIIGAQPHSSFDGAAYQSIRKGSGLVWLLPELLFYASIAVMAWILRLDSSKRSKINYALLILIMIIVAWMSSQLFSRRLIAGLLVASCLLLTIRYQRLWPVTAFAIVGTVGASGVFEIIRQLYIFSTTESTRSVSAVLHDILVHKPISLISGSFEGAGHLARFFEKSSWLEILSGVDHGLSWLFNAGLALVPRVVWTDKPLIYGGIEQFHWIYPNMFDGSFATAAVPMSFAVDFTFGFGVLGAVLMGYLLGRIFGISERWIWDRASSPAQLALALYIFVFMFNWVRGGTIIVQSLIIFSVPCVILFGLRSTLQAGIGLVGETIGLTSGKWWRATRVYFYPHAYLRDRQLDTISHWPQADICNADMRQNRTGAQVTRTQSLSPSGKSWKSILPLINIKPRPQNAPDDATVYVWGGLIAKGPFICDIDNPYAFCAYNTLAVKLYRPIIRAFLESPRCLQIRCLSQACLDGVRKEYGDVAAAKAVVAYPVMTPTDSAPIDQYTQPCEFLFVSTQFEIKGGKALLNAFENVVTAVPDAKLHLVTHLPDQYQDQVASNPNIIVHEANFNRAEIAERFLSKCHVLVHPTYFDSFGMVVLEALAHGLPVIATDVYALPELVQSNVNGIVITPPLSIWSGTKPSPLFSDIQKVQEQARIADTTTFEQALTEAMIKLAQNPDLRHRFATASLEKVHQKFSTFI